MRNEDRISETWLRLRKHIDAEIERLRGDLETIGFSEEQSALARGELRGLRALIKTVEPDAPIIEATSSGYNRY